MNAPRQNTTACRRCGTCCRKGGPALHLKDRELVASGVIPLASLFTIRRREPAFDNVTGRVEPAPTDIIKVKPSGRGLSACFYYRQQPVSCAIYAQRPMECRVMQCWDTREIEAVYRHDRLTREHLLAGHAGIWDLVVEHHGRCDYDAMAGLAARLEKVPDDPTAVDALLSMLRYDQSLRETVGEQAGLAPDLFDFLFGRPMTVTLALFNLKLVKGSSPGQYQIQPI